MTQTKEARLNVRLRPEDDALIREGAARAGQSVSAFLTSAAVDRAQELLADERVFLLDAEAWDEFVALLDRPARPDPRLAGLLARPQRIAR